MVGDSGAGKRRESRKRIALPERKRPERSRGIMQERLRGGPSSSPLNRATVERRVEGKGGKQRQKKQKDHHFIGVAAGKGPLKKKKNVREGASFTGRSEPQLAT